MQESELKPPRHESSDVGVRLIWIGVPAVLIGVLVFSWLVMMIYHGGTSDRTLKLPLPHYPAPELQSDPVRDLTRLRQAELEQLNGSGWVDASRSIAHIPIEQAMQQVAREGIADWPAAGPGQPHAR